jgi:hypothetical protein
MYWTRNSFDVPVSSLLVPQNCVSHTHVCGVNPNLDGYTKKVGSSVAGSHLIINRKQGGLPMRDPPPHRATIGPTGSHI